MELLEWTTATEGGRHAEEVAFPGTQISEVRGEVDCALVCEFRGEGADVGCLERVSFARQLKTGTYLGVLTPRRKVWNAAW